MAGEGVYMSRILAMAGGVCHVRDGLRTHGLLWVCVSARHVGVGVGIGAYSRKKSCHILMGGVISEHGDIE
jgi:hypothetical protein